jgi:futalosine hydrolase
MPAAIALISSVALETDPAVTRLASPARVEVGRRPAVAGTIGGTPVVVLTGGMGKTNAAQSLTALLEHHEIRAVVGFGVAGAYAGSGLAVGGLAVASSEIYADEGVETPSGWISTESIGIPLAASEAGDLFNEFPVDRARLELAVRRLEADGLAFAVGRFTTVSCCSGTTARGRELATRFDAICETMEGAAYAHVAALYGVPFLELRGISNLVEDRDRSSWRLADAAEVAARAACSVAPLL